MKQHALTHKIRPDGTVAPTSRPSSTSGDSNHSNSAAAGGNAPNAGQGFPLDGDSDALSDSSNQGPTTPAEFGLKRSPPEMDAPLPKRQHGESPF